MKQIEHIHRKTTNFLLKDGVKYLEYDFPSETEFENIVFSQYKDIFGDNSILFPKQKIKTPAGIGTIPDAFVIDIDSKKWYIIEIELSSHDVYRHIVPQLTKFASALNNAQTRKSLRRFFLKEIKSDPYKIALLSVNGIQNEIFELITDTVEKTPELIIIIEKQNPELNSISLPFKSQIRVFKIYVRENFGLGDNIYSFEPIKKSASFKPDSKERLNEVLPPTEFKIPRNKDQLKDYLIPVIKQIKNGINHKDAFKEIASKLKVKYQTVSARCTRDIGINTNKFLVLIDNGEIKNYLKRKFPNRTSEIDGKI